MNVSVRVVSPLTPDESLSAYVEGVLTAFLADGKVDAAREVIMDAVRHQLRTAVAAERAACAAVVLADLEAGPGRVEALLRFDNGRSEQAARRIAAAIEARGVIP